MKFHVQPLSDHHEPSGIIALFRVVNRYVGNLAPMPGVFPDYPAPVVRNTEAGRELSMMRCGAADATPTATGFAHRIERRDGVGLCKEPKE